MKVQEMELAEALTGNQSIAWGVRRSKPQIIVAYPITPQSEIVETLCRWVADGEIEAQFINPEGEFSVGGILAGASDAGARVFSATSAQGLAFGFEYFSQIGWSRLPVVMAITNRTLGGYNIFCDHRDSHILLNQNWILLYCEDHQEALDTIIQAFKIAENPKVSTPVAVCIDGFYITHTTSIVKIPRQSQVDEFLPPPPRCKPLMFPEMDIKEKFEMLRNLWAKEKLRADVQQMAKSVIEEVDKDYGKSFGRSYGGLIEAYRCDDAEMAFVAMGSMVGTAKDVVDEYRDKGIPLGLIKVKALRPFPTERIRELAGKIKVFLVMDRSTAWGSPSNGGVLFEDLKAALYNLEPKPLMLDFIVGLTGTDVIEDDFKHAVTRGLKALKSSKVKDEVEWLYFGEPYEVETFSMPPLKKFSIKPPYDGRVVLPGDVTCPGCPIPLVLRHILENLGKTVVPIHVVGCMAISPTIVGPWCQALLSGGACYASGVSRALTVLGRKEGVEVVYIGGDGSVADVGFQPLSGAAERNEDITVICLDNEAYMNTGIQRSGATPLYAWTTTTQIGKVLFGKSEGKKDVPLILAAHGIPYTATVTVSHINDMVQKARKAAGIKGFKYIHALVPCPTGWRFPSEKSIEIARLAVETGYFPLYEVENGLKFNFTVKLAKPKPINDFLKLQGRFSHLTASQIQEIQNQVNVKLQYLRHLERFSIQSGKV